MIKFFSPLIKLRFNEKVYIIEEIKKFLLINIRRGREKIEVLRNHELFHYFHLEKLRFQSLKGEIFKDKDKFLYFILTLYLLYLKIIVDIKAITDFNFLNLISHLCKY